MEFFFDLELDLDFLCDLEFDFDFDFIFDLDLDLDFDFLPDFELDLDFQCDFETDLVFSLFFLFLDVLFVLLFFETLSVSSLLNFKEMVLLPFFIFRCASSPEDY